MPNSDLTTNINRANEQSTAYNSASRQSLDFDSLQNLSDRSFYLSSTLFEEDPNLDSSSPQLSSENPTRDAFLQRLQDANISRGTGNNDVLTGRFTNDTLYGLAGDDVLSGRAGDDRLNGGTGRDRIRGGLGNDRIIDEDGGDVLSGGTGADQFWIAAWQSPETPSTIVDFEVGTDQIRIQRLGATFEGLQIQDTDQGVLISDQGTAIAHLLGVQAANLTSESFIFGDPALAQQLQTTLETSVRETEFPGATNALITPDGFTWQGAAGVSNLETQTPMQPDDLLKIASITKPVTGATVLRVVEDGKLSLDDTMGQWLPEIAQQIPDSENVTVRQLLNGSGGIFDNLNNPQFLEDIATDFVSGSTRDWQPEDIVTYSYGQLRFSGASSSPFWTYPQTGTTLAGLIVERATGKSLGQVMREEVLDPLGMESTFFSPEEPIVGNVARGYTDYFRADGTLGTDGIPEDFTRLNDNVAWASGNLTATAQDVARFSQGLFSGELLSTESMREMLNFVPEGIPFEGEEYGLGTIRFETEFGDAWGKTGSTPGYRAGWYYLPNQGGATSVVLPNGNNGFPNADPDIFSVLNSSLNAIV
jgi:CubicO group peptidase (beta-lactamase class C family)